TDLPAAWKKLRLSVYVIGAILLLLTGFYFTASFSGGNDKGLKDNFKQSMLQQVPPGQQPPPQLAQQAEVFSSELISALRADRKDLMGADLLKNILLIGVAVV